MQLAAPDGFGRDLCLGRFGRLDNWHMFDLMHDLFPEATTPDITREQNLDGGG